jgi:hypothetical protein
MTFRPVIVLTSLVLVLSACDTSNRLSSDAIPRVPTSPSATSDPTMPPPNTARAGQIQLTSVSAAEGSLIRAVDCSVAYGNGHVDNRHVCTQQWSGTFDVDYDMQIADAILTVQFVGDDGECGTSYSATEPFAGGRQKIVVSGISFTDVTEEGEIVARCVMPRTTTRMVAKFWRRSYPREPLLTGTFNQKYSFDKR